MNTIVIDVQKLRVDSDPPVEIFTVVIETIEEPQPSEWRETFTTEDQVRAFFRGLKAAPAMLHNVLMPGNPCVTFHPNSIVQLL